MDRCRNVPSLAMVALVLAIGGRAPAQSSPQAVPAGAAPSAGIAVFIEDDLLVTEDGVENLTATLPRAPEELEALVSPAAPPPAAR